MVMLYSLGAAPVDGDAVYLAACTAREVLQHTARVGGDEGCPAPTSERPAHGPTHRQELNLVNFGAMATLKNIFVLTNLKDIS